jgi:sulfite reductase (NADPH) flavoprotein alpha-component
MPRIPFIPESAPFSPDQRLWLNGYLAGLYSDATGAGSASAPKAPAKPVTILYGSQTGTAEGLAKKTSNEAAKRGFSPKLVDMAKHDSIDLTNEEYALVITSTYGDGEPPDNAQAFWSFISGETAPALPNLRYSVLALGDTNYPAFCEFGKQCDTRLEELGATRIHPRVDCDVEYDEPASAWKEAVFAALAEASGGPEAAVLTDSLSMDALKADEGFSKKNPFQARMVANRLLNAPGSAKEVRHFEISLAGSGLNYEVGDALGVLPANCPEMVSELLALLHCDGEEAVKTADGNETSLRLALTQHYDITRPSTELLSALASRTPGSAIAGFLNPVKRDDLKAFLYGREVIDLLTITDAPIAAEELIGLLKKLQPRLYSISSSPKAHPGEVHLTVGAVRYEAHGRVRKGVCSTFLADRCGAETTVPVFVQTSHGFRLPEDGDRPVIMVGPGTGIAPFRAFLEERRAVGAKGRNWLFFGDQRRDSDFLYRDELEPMLGDGHLTRLDLAFSRDQAEKVYVQHRMTEAAEELWAWLEAGAHFYVCGDASRMAKDVDAALHRVCEVAGGLGSDGAAEYVKNLKNARRYQRDVY